MNADFSIVLQLVLRSFTEPREVATFLTSRRLDRGTLWLIMALVVVLTALILSLSSAITPPPPEMAAIVLSPLTASMILGFLLVALVFTLYFTGRMMGGTGHFPETIMIVAWHQAVTIGFQVGVLAISLISPVLGGFASLLGLGFLFYIMLQFIDVLHGFNSLAKSFGTFAFALVGMVLGLSFILSLIGFSSASLG